MEGLWSDLKEEFEANFKKKLNIIIPHEPSTEKFIQNFWERRFIKLMDDEKTKFKEEREQLIWEMTQMKSELNQQKELNRKSEEIIERQNMEFEYCKNKLKHFEDKIHQSELKGNLSFDSF